MRRSTMGTLLKSARPRATGASRVATAHAVGGVLLQYGAHLPAMKFRLIQIRQNHLRGVRRHFKNTVLIHDADAAHFQLGPRGGVIGAPQGQFHVPRNGSGDQQHVGVARAGDELDAVPFEVVVGILSLIHI